MSLQKNQTLHQNLHLKMIWWIPGHKKSPHLLLMDNFQHVSTTKMLGFQQRQLWPGPPGFNASICFTQSHGGLEVFGWLDFYASGPFFCFSFFRGSTLPETNSKRPAPKNRMVSKFGISGKSRGGQVSGLTTTKWAPNYQL